ncbi:response regulator [Spirosoma foliorum]|uniref:Response regulator n=1 Tax=Spirosoma foliorum TaxID=2710596 RepID=A0A7G5GQ32_9BACT|nr:response regulator [Spirosoma foliorum]QMW00974.1 response regulator [Spirosoma foliorum]
MNSGPIIIVEDDEDDQFLLQRIFQELEVENPVHYFSNGQQVLDYLTTTDEIPFLILCDVNMPIMSGIELRKLISEHDTLSQKAIPFIYLSTDASLPIVENVYKDTIQGFFQKAVGYQAAKEQLYWILGYWQYCVFPHK